MPGQRRPGDLPVGEHLEPLQVGVGVEDAPAPALAPQGPHAGGRPGQDDLDAVVADLLAEGPERLPVGLVEEAAEHEEGAQPVDPVPPGPQGAEGRLEGLGRAGQHGGGGRGDAVAGDAGAEVDGREAGAAGPVDQLPELQRRAGRRDVDDGVVAGEPGQVQDAPARLAEPLDVFRRVPDGDVAVEVPVDRLVGRVDQVAVDLRHLPPELGPGDGPYELPLPEADDGPLGRAEDEGHRLGRDVAPAGGLELGQIVEAGDVAGGDAGGVEPAPVEGGVGVEVVGDVLPQLFFLLPEAVLRLLVIPLHIRHVSQAGSRTQS